MPIALPNTTVADAYPGASGGAQIAGHDIFASGWFTVANNAVNAEYVYGVQGFGKFGPEMYLAPGTYPMAGSEKNPLQGIRFKNAVAGRAAQVWGSFFYKDDPVIASSSEFTAQISSSGSISPGASAVQIQKDGVLIGSEPVLDFEAGPAGWTITDDVANTRVKITPLKMVAGLIDSAGNILSGSGFTVARAGVRYDISFNNAFASPPQIFLQPVRFNATPTAAIVTATGNGSFSCYMYQSNLAGDPITNAFNQEFFFLAIPQF